jgi:acetoin utilization deacetylase AcuC-like enzyme
MSSVLSTKVLIISNFSSSLIEDLEKYNIVRAGTNKPEERQKLIIEYLAKYYKIINPAIIITDQDIINAGHTEDYIKFLKNCYASFKTMPDPQYTNEDSYGLMPLNFCKIPYDSKKATLLDYKKMAYYAEDTMSPIYENTYDICVACANNAFVCKFYLKDYNIVYLSNTMPSHHASASLYGGYCFINTTKIVESELTKMGEKVCIVDIDYHAGHGTQQMYYRQKDVLTISIHADPLHDYPSVIGYEDEVGEYGMNMNIIFEKGANWDSYKNSLLRATNRIAEFNPTVIIINFGFDTYEKDTDASVNYGCGLKIDDYYKIGCEFKKLNKKYVVSQEGGYYILDGPVIVHSLLRGLEDYKN